MTPFQAYETLTTLKLHFNSASYDYVKYNGKSRLNESTFANRPDRVFYQKLAKHPDPWNFILANVLSNPSTFVRDIAYSEHSERVYADWLRRNESLTYLFGGDVAKLPNLKEALVVPLNGHPKILKEYYARHIIPETAAILLDRLKLWEHYDKKLADDPMWKVDGRFLRKYAQLIKYDKSKITKIIVDRYRSE